MAIFSPKDPGFPTSEIFPGTHITAKGGVAMLVPEADFVLTYGCNLPEGFAAYAYIPRGGGFAGGVVNAMKTTHLSRTDGRREAARNIRYRVYYDDIIPTMDKGSHQVGWVRGSRVRLQNDKIGHTHHTAQTHKLCVGQLYRVCGDVPEDLLAFPKDTNDGDLFKVFRITTKGAIHGYFPRQDVEWRIHQYPDGGVLTKHLMLVRNTPTPKTDTPLRWVMEDWHSSKGDDLAVVTGKDVRLSYRNSKVRIGSNGTWRSRNKLYKNFFAIPRKA